MKQHKIMKWDEGQILIKAHDCLAACSLELKETQPGFSKALKEMALKIGTIFNGFSSHDFGLPDESQKDPSICDTEKGPR